MCQRTKEVQLYHDGRLNKAAAAEFEQHLETCGACAAELAELRRIRGALKSARLPQMPWSLPATILEACKEARQTQDAGLRHLAGWLTAAAAAVLFVAMLRVTISRMNPAEIDRTAVAELSGGGSSAVHDWDLAAVMPPASRTGDDGGSADVVQLAQWMARDLSPDAGR